VSSRHLQSSSGSLPTAPFLIGWSWPSCAGQLGRTLCAGPGTPSPPGKRRGSIRQRPATARQHRYLDTSRPPRPRANGAPGLFVRIGGANSMAAEDVYRQYCRLCVRLRENGGERHAMPCHRLSRRCRPAQRSERGRHSARSVAAPVGSPAQTSRKRLPTR
jgi:hypothetical protein